MMRPVSGVCLFALLLSSCTNGGTSTKATVDSTVDKVDSAAGAIYDSAKEGFKDIKAGLDSTFDKKDFDKK